MMNVRYSLSLVLSTLTLLPGWSWAADQRQSVEQLTNTSEKIVLGTVLSRSSHWTSDSLIYTDVVLSSEAALKGDSTESSVILQVPGGTVGDTQMTISDSPEFAQGERVLVFLNRKNDRYEVMGRDAGKYTLGSQTAAEAVDSVLQIVEKRTGHAFGAKRGLAVSLAAVTATPQAATATQIGCYSTSGAKWPTSTATYKIGTSIPADWPASLNAATATWNAVGASFNFVNDSSSVNELSYLDLVAKYGSSYSSTYAVTTTWTNTTTNMITKATIEINTGFQWSTSGEANKADVQNIMTHEFGHWLRLGDIYSPSACGEVTMWGYAALGETKKRTLEADDVTGFTSLYSTTSTTTLAEPSPASPANGATGVPATPSLTWGAVSGATSYDVYLGTSTSPALAGTVTGTSYQPSAALTAGTTYYWKVVARNSSTSSTSSTTWSFTTASPTTTGSLTAPVLTSPANGATGISLTPTLRWNAVAGATSYAIYVGTTSNPSLIGSVTGTAVTVSGFRSGTTYYWKIVAKNSTASSTSTVWSFKTN